LNEPNDTKKDLFILINEFEQESHEVLQQIHTIKKSSGTSAKKYFPPEILHVK